MEPITLSVIIPTYNEKGNMEPLLTQIDEVMKSAEISYEVIVMDDNSPDKTVEEVWKCATLFIDSESDFSAHFFFRVLFSFSLKGRKSCPKV